MGVWVWSGRGGERRTEGEDLIAGRVLDLRAPPLPVTTPHPPLSQHARASTALRGGRGEEEGEGGGGRGEEEGEARRRAQGWGEREGG
eukprot:754510-Rhodomonas_salina.1